MRKNFNILLIAISFIFILGCSSTEEKKRKKEVITELSPQEQLIQLSKQIESKPTASVYNQRANVYNSINELSLALDDVKRAIKLDSTNGKYYFKAAQLFRKDSRINASINFAIKATQYGHNDGEVFILLAENYLIFRKYQAAIDNLNEAMRVDRFNEYIYFLKGMVFKESGEFKNAESSFQTAIELNPSYAEAYNQLIALALSNENFDRAQTYINSGLRFAPTDPFLWFNQGVSLQEQQLYDSSIVPYQKSIYYDSTLTIAKFNLAYVYNVLGKHEQSIVKAEQVLYSEPNNVAALYLNALNYKAIGEKDKAIDLLKKALRVNAEHKPSLQLYNELN